MSTSSHHELSEPLQNWLKSLPPTMPMRATTNSPMIEGKRLEHWIAESNLPADSLVAAMLWLRIGLIDPTHEIVQAETTPLGSYLHGVVHRLEGDYWNSKYWFRQVRDNRLLQSISQSMEQRLEEEGLMSMALSLSIMSEGIFHPSGLVTAIENQSQQPDSESGSVLKLERISWIEWTSLWENA